jgi:hypothetical protein
MDISLFVSESGLVEFERSRIQKKQLIHQMPNRKLRNILFKNIDLPIATLAEIYVAMAKDYIVSDGNGYDFTSRSGRVKRENKFATLCEYNRVKRYTNKDGTQKVYNNLSKSACVSNLRSKNCDLVVLIDMGGWLKYYELPVAIWKKKWTGNSATMTFGDRPHWYDKYEVSKEKFFSGESVWLC